MATNPFEEFVQPVSTPSVSQQSAASPGQNLLTGVDAGMKALKPDKPWSPSFGQAFDTFIASAANDSIGVPYRIATGKPFLDERQRRRASIYWKSSIGGSVLGSVGSLNLAIASAGLLAPGTAAASFPVHLGARGAAQVFASGADKLADTGEVKPVSLVSHALLSGGFGILYGDILGKGLVVGKKVGGESIARAVKIASGKANIFDKAAQATSQAIKELGELGVKVPTSYQFGYTPASFWAGTAKVGGEILAVSAVENLTKQYIDIANGDRENIDVGEVAINSALQAMIISGFRATAGYAKWKGNVVQYAKGMERNLPAHLRTVKDFKSALTLMKKADINPLHVDPGYTRALKTKTISDGKAAFIQDCERLGINSKKVKPEDLYRLDLKGKFMDVVGKDSVQAQKDYVSNANYIKKFFKQEQLRNLGVHKTRPIKDVAEAEAFIQKVSALLKSSNIPIDIGGGFTASVEGDKFVQAGPSKGSLKPYLDLIQKGYDPYEIYLYQKQISAVDQLLRSEYVQTIAKNAAFAESSKLSGGRVNIKLDSKYEVATKDGTNPGPVLKFSPSQMAKGEQILNLALLRLAKKDTQAKIAFTNTRAKDLPTDYRENIIGDILAVGEEATDEHLINLALSSLVETPETQIWVSRRESTDDLEQKIYVPRRNSHMSAKDYALRYAGKIDPESVEVHSKLSLGQTERAETLRKIIVDQLIRETDKLVHKKRETDKLDEKKFEEVELPIEPEENLTKEALKYKSAEEFVEENYNTDLGDYKLVKNWIQKNTPKQTL